MNLDIRDGTFSKISKNYLINEEQTEHNTNFYTTDSFEEEMKMLVIGFQNKFNKAVTFFQGLYAGMVLLYAITLNLSETISTGLVRVEDQTIRILSLLSIFGSLYSVINAYKKRSFVIKQMN